MGRYSKQKLAEMVYSEDEKLRMKAADHGVGLDVLVKDSNCVVRAHVARQGFGLDKLLHDESWMVRAQVAQQGYGLETLMNDPDPYVRATAARETLLASENPPANLLKEEAIRKAIAGKESIWVTFGKGSETLRISVPTNALLISDNIVHKYSLSSKDQKRLESFLAGPDPRGWCGNVHINDIVALDFKGKTMYRDEAFYDPSHGGMDRSGKPGMNTKISYLYRDADNYKVYNECIIPGVLTQEQKESILDCCLDGEWFIPSLVGLPEKDFTSLGYSYDPDVDHCWFEINEGEDAFEEVDAPATVDVTAQELAAAFSVCDGKWERISREEVVQAIKGQQEPLKVNVFRSNQTEGEQYSEALKFWSNALGELHHHGQYDITEAELPAELHHAYNDLFTDEFASLCYLVETKAGYGIALLNEYDRVTAECTNGDMDELFPCVLKDAHDIAENPLFQKAQIYLGEYMGFDECHELVVVFPADISTEEFRQAAAALDSLTYQAIHKAQKTSLDDRLHDAAARAGDPSHSLDTKSRESEPSL